MFAKTRFLLTFALEDLHCRRFASRFCADSDEPNTHNFFYIILRFLGMRKFLLAATALTTCMTVWSLDLITEAGIPASKGTPAPQEVDVPHHAPSINYATASLPYYQSFDNAEALNEMTFISKPTSKKWEWIASCPTFNESCAKIKTDYWSGVKAYMILPAMDLQPGEYILKFEAWGQSDFNKETIAAYCAAGTSQDDMDAASVVVEPKELEGYCYNPNGGKQEKQSIEGSINITTAGTYHFVITPAKSSGGMAVFVDNISVSQAVTATAPSAVTDMTVEADGAGALSATVSVVAPATDINGDPLELLDGVKLYRGSELVDTKAATPGDEVTFTDTPATPGNYVYRAVAFNAGGDGEAATVQAYVGHAAPAEPQNFYASHGAGDRDVELGWDTPVDVYGKTFTNDEITYSIKCTKPELIDWFEPLVADLSGNTYSFTVPEFAGDQAFLRFSMVAKNKYGQESAVFFPEVRIPVGKPYACPFNESFAGGELSYLFRTKMEGNFGLWGLADDELYASYDLGAQDGDNGFMLYAGMEPGDAAGLYSGVIDLTGLNNPALSFYYFGQDTDNELIPMIKTDKTFEPLGDPIKMSDGNENLWNHHIYSLLPYAGKRVELAFRAISHEAGFVAIDNVSLFDQLSNDLAVSVIAPAKAALGEAITVKANISNLGAHDAAGYSVLFFADGKEFASLDGPDMPAASDDVVEAAFYAPADQGEREYTFHAVVEYDKDGNLDNNTSATVATRTVKSIHPAPRNLQVEINDDKATFSWEAPDTNTGVILPKTDGFEVADAWSNAASTGWIIVDNDKGGSGFFQDFDIPAINAGEPASWFVLDGSDENCINYGLTAHYGNHALAVLYNGDGTANDDWAISPELSGVAQTVTFFARSYSATYPDDFEVLYSNGSTDVDDFKPIPGASYKGVSSSWKEYVVALPEGTKRFAIRYTAKDAFCLLVDDFTFTPAGGSVAEYTLEGYRLYRDGELLTAATLPASGLNYDLEGSEEFLNRHFHVTAVYKRYGESAPSNTVTPAENSIHEVEVDASGSEVYYTPAGIRVPGTPTDGGIYIVRRADGSSAKVIR